jgi:hypothetical protein
MITFVPSFNHHHVYFSKKRIIAFIIWLYNSKTKVAYNFVKQLPYFRSGDQSLLLDHHFQ